MNTHELLIWHDPNTNAATLLNAITACGARLRYHSHAAPNMLAVSLPPQLPLQQAQDYFWKVRGVMLVYANNQTA